MPMFAMRGGAARLQSIFATTFGLALMLAGTVAATSDIASTQASTLEALRSHDRARSNADEEGARRALVAAEAGLRALIAAAPANGNQWALLARVDAALNGFGAATETYLRMSRVTAAYEFPALHKRVALGVACLTELDSAGREALLRDIDTLLSAEPKHREVAFLADAARLRSPGTIALVRGAIARTAPGWAAAFDQFARYKPKF